MPGEVAASLVIGRLVPPSRYFHVTELVTGEPVAASVTQSFKLPGPLATVTVIVPPGATAVGDAVIVGVGAASSLTMVPTPDRKSVAEGKSVVLVGLRVTYS